jgi:hypothetical protein
LRFEAALQQKIAEPLHEFVEIDGVSGFSGVLPVFDDLHEAPSFGVRQPGCRFCIFILRHLKAGARLSHSKAQL